MDFSKPSTFLKGFSISLVIIVFLLFMIYYNSGINTGINKTIGWAWEIGQNGPMIILLVTAAVIVLSMIFYATLYLIKLKVNKYIAASHFVSILILCASGSLVTRVGYYIPLLLLIMSVMLLLINTTIAIIGGLKKKSTLHS